MTIRFGGYQTFTNQRLQSDSKSDVAKDFREDTVPIGKNK